MSRRYEHRVSTIKTKSVPSIFTLDFEELTYRKWFRGLELQVAARNISLLHLKRCPHREKPGPSQDLPSKFHLQNDRIGFNLGFSV